MVATILRINADIVCLQELREDAVFYLQSSSAIAAVYHAEFGRTNGTDMSLFVMTLYKKKMWSCTTVRRLWFDSDTMVDHWAEGAYGNGFGRLVLETVFVPVAVPAGRGKPVAYGAPTSASTLIVYNSHFGLGEAERMQQAQALHHLAVQQCGGHRAVIIAGDLNSFPDAGGDAQMRVLEGDPPIFHNAVPYGGHIETLTGICVMGTQISYPYDTYTRYKGTDHEEICPREGEMGGRLDHVLYSFPLMLLSSVLQTYRMDGTLAVNADFGYHREDTVARFPSDHLPWLVTFAEVQAK